MARWEAWYDVKRDLFVGGEWSTAAGGAGVFECERYVLRPAFWPVFVTHSGSFWTHFYVEWFCSTTDDAMRNRQSAARQHEKQ